MKIYGAMVLAFGVSVALLTSRRAEAAGAACQAVTCDGDPDCSAGTRCVAGADPSCVADGGSICGLCMVSWQAPCQADSDCGDGFVCGAGGDCLDGAACDAA